MGAKFDTKLIITLKASVKILTLNLKTMHGDITSMWSDLNVSTSTID